MLGCSFVSHEIRQRTTRRSALVQLVIYHGSGALSSIDPTRLAAEMLKSLAKIYELHIYTMGTRRYAEAIVQYALVLYPRIRSTHSLSGSWILKAHCLPRTFSHRTKHLTDAQRLRFVRGHDSPARFVLTSPAHRIWRRCFPEATTWLPFSMTQPRCGAIIRILYRSALAQQTVFD